MQGALCDEAEARNCSHVEACAGRDIQGIDWGSNESSREALRASPAIDLPLRIILAALRVGMCYQKKVTIWNTMVD